jgi:ABC-type Na+ transport system ATPase subunit NatA
MIQTPGFAILEKDPIDKEIVFQSLSFEVSKRLTLCEELRFIFDAVNQIQDLEIKQTITEQLIDAMIMAKKMDSRLGEYRKAEQRKPGHRGRNLLKLEGFKERIAFRQNRNI